MKNQQRENIRETIRMARKDEKPRPEVKDSGDPVWVFFLLAGGTLALIGGVIYGIVTSMYAGP